MAKVQLSPIALPVTVLPALFKMNPIPCKSEMTPFSAVAPAQVLAVSRIQIETSLETIYEDEILITTIEGDDGDDDFVEVATTSGFRSPPTTLLSSTTATCLLELHKSFSSAAFCHIKFQCAN